MCVSNTTIVTPHYHHYATLRLLHQITIITHLIAGVPCVTEGSLSPPQ